VVRRIGVEQTPDHALVLGAMFPRLTLEELDASLAQRNGDLHPLIPKDKILGPRQEIGHDLKVSEGLVRVFDFPVHRWSLMADSDFVNTPCGYRYCGTTVSMLASRTITHAPACFCRMDSVWPARLTGAPPFLGVTTTESLVQRYAHSPNTLTS